MHDHTAFGLFDQQPVITHQLDQVDEGIFVAMKINRVTRPVNPVTDPRIGIPGVVEPSLRVMATQHPQGKAGGVGFADDVGRHAEPHPLRVERRAVVQPQPQVDGGLAVIVHFGKVRREEHPQPLGQCRARGLIVQFKSIASIAKIAAHECRLSGVVMKGDGECRKANRSVRGQHSWRRSLRNACRCSISLRRSDLID